MATIPKLKVFAEEDYKDAPEWFSRFLVQLNMFLTAVTNALTGRLTPTENGLAYYEPLDFTTEATASNTFPLRLKNKLLGGAKPMSVTVSRLALFGGSAPSAAYSPSWTSNQSGEIEFSLQGLANSTRYVGVLLISA